MLQSPQSPRETLGDTQQRSLHAQPTKRYMSTDKRWLVIGKRSKKGMAKSMVVIFRDWTCGETIALELRQLGNKAGLTVPYPGRVVLNRCHTDGSEPADQPLNLSAAADKEEVLMRKRDAVR
jgi:hypothetical protein